MSSVLVVIIIPQYQCEIEIREKEKNIRSKKKIKDLSVDIEKSEENEQISLEKIVQDGLSYLGIPDATWQKSFNGKYWHILFPVDLEDSDIVIQHFKSHGIGLRLSTSIGIIPFSLFCYNEDEIPFEEQNDINNFKEKQGKFLKSVTARLTVAQIVSSVRASATVTFDFICYLIFASWIAAMGLLDNSVISLVASMLVSPMMGPVMALAFGTIIKDRSLRNMGAKNILVCLLVTISFGFLFGMIALNFIEPWSRSLNTASHINNMTWPTDMMKERGLTRVAWVGTLVAFPSGCAVAISLLSGNDASLVGVAISVSLLPPAVNAGLLWAFSLLKFLQSLNEHKLQPIYSQFNTSEIIYMKNSFIPGPNYSVVYNDNMSIETLFLGLLSLTLSLINIANIIIGALLLLKIKEIYPLSSLSPESRRFFQEDIKIAREYNQKSPTGNLGEDVLREWATIAGLDSEKVMKPEARAVQLQTLVDIAKDVEADQVFQTVTKNINNTDNLARRLSQGLFSIANRKDSRSRRSSSSEVFSNNPSIVISETFRRPSNVFYNGHNRRRISTVALNHYLEKENDPLNNRTNGINNNAFTFNEADINFQNKEKMDKNRRNSSALLRMTLQNSEHSPYSLWPATRFTVVSDLNENPQSAPPNSNTR